jgi:hypothetical protein
MGRVNISTFVMMLVFCWARSGDKEFISAPSFMTRNHTNILIYLLIFIKLNQNCLRNQDGVVPWKNLIRLYLKFYLKYNNRLINWLWICVETFFLKFRAVDTPRRLPKDLTKDANPLPPPPASLQHTEPQDTKPEIFNAGCHYCRLFLPIYIKPVYFWEQQQPWIR